MTRKAPVFDVSCGAAARERGFRRLGAWLSGLACVAAAATTGCRVTPGTPHERHGDEILVAGQMFRTGAPVVLWIDDDGYDAYRADARFEPYESSSWEDIKDDLPSYASPNRFSLRKSGFGAGVADLTDEQIEAVRHGRWDLESLQRVVDQFVVHYDVCGVSEHTFRILHDKRSLSVHFLLDVDGTIYQTLDLQERAWHAGSANSRSVGIEIAHIGAYPPDHELSPLDTWYIPDETGRLRVNIPERLGQPRTPGFVARPSSDEPVLGEIHGRMLKQYDYTDEQYESLAHLVATLNRVLPNIELTVPRDARGRVRSDRLSDEELARYKGLIAHWHLTTNKIDPGPAFDWDRVIERAKELR